MFVSESVVDRHEGSAVGHLQSSSGSSSSSSSITVLHLCGLWPLQLMCWSEELAAAAAAVLHRCCDWWPLQPVCHFHNRRQSFPSDQQQQQGLRQSTAVASAAVVIGYTLLPMKHWNSSINQQGAGRAAGDLQQPNTKPVCQLILPLC